MIFVTKDNIFEGKVNKKGHPTSDCRSLRPKGLIPVLGRQKHGFERRFEEHPVEDRWQGI
jgi:hypothetical protein